MRIWCFTVDIYDIEVKAWNLKSAYDILHQTLKHKNIPSHDIYLHSGFRWSS